MSYLTRNKGESSIYLTRNKGESSISQDDGITVEIYHHSSGGLGWKYINSNGEELSVICHCGSYGSGKGLFEILPSWRNPNGKYKYADSIKGYCTFGEVQKWINELRKRAHNGSYQNKGAE